MRNMTVTKTKKAIKMLVVEDQGEMCLILDLILTDRKFESDYVNNLLDADEYLQKNKPSLIFLDNKLPDGYGVDFISYVKKKYPKIKIIIKKISHKECNSITTITRCFVYIRFDRCEKYKKLPIREASIIL